MTHLFFFAYLCSAFAHHVITKKNPGESHRKPCITKRESRKRGLTPRRIEKTLKCGAILYRQARLLCATPTLPRLEAATGQELSVGYQTSIFQRSYGRGKACDFRLTS